MPKSLVPVGIESGWFTRLLSTVLISQDVVLYGMNLPSSVPSLSMTIPVGKAVISGVKVTSDITVKEFSPNKDTYINLDINGEFVFTEVSNGAIEPESIVNSKRIAKVVTDVTTIISVVDRRFDNIGDYPEAYTSDGTLSAIGVVGGSSGGTVRIVGGKYLYFRGQYLLLPSFTSNTLSINSTFHLRVSISDTDGSVVYDIVVPEGTGDVDVVNDSNKTKFVLVVRIVTKVAGSVPAVTNLNNRRILSSILESQKSVKVDKERKDDEEEDEEEEKKKRRAVNTLQVFQVDWARTPFYSVLLLGYATDSHEHLGHGWVVEPRFEWIPMVIRLFLDDPSRYNAVLTYRHRHKGKDSGAVSFQLLAMSKP